MPLFRKKPVVIHAEQWDGVSFDRYLGWPGFSRSDEGLLTIATLEGQMTVSPGDWIITGVHGEKYPCKPDIFALTYELVPEGA